MVQLAVKITGGVQKFKLPFKNLSQYLDSEVEFAFIKTQQKAGEAESDKLLEPIECL